MTTGNSGKGTWPGPGRQSCDSRLWLHLSRSTKSDIGYPAGSVFPWVDSFLPLHFKTEKLCLQTHAYDTVWTDEDQLNCAPVPWGQHSKHRFGAQSQDCAHRGVGEPGLLMQEREGGRTGLPWEQREPGVHKQGSVS